MRNWTHRVCVCFYGCENFNCISTFYAKYTNIMALSTFIRLQIIITLTDLFLSFFCWKWILLYRLEHVLMDCRRSDQQIPKCISLLKNHYVCWCTFLNLRRRMCTYTIWLFALYLCVRALFDIWASAGEIDWFTQMQKKNLGKMLSFVVFRSRFISCVNS